LARHLPAQSQEKPPPYCPGTPPIFADEEGIGILCNPVDPALPQVAAILRNPVANVSEMKSRALPPRQNADVRRVLAMMLEHLGEQKPARTIEAAVKQVLPPRQVPEILRTISIYFASHTRNAV